MIPARRFRSSAPALLPYAAVLLLCPVLLAGIALVAQEARRRSADAMAEAAARFLSALSAAERAKTLFALEDAERFDWGYVPKSRRGISLKELDSEKRRLVLDLLRTGVSRVGYRKATDVIALENVLRELQGSSIRDPQLYYLTIFGTPASGAPWGWRFEGHHLSLNYTVAGGFGVATAPSFFGANPARVASGPLAGKRALAGEEDLARELLLSLDAARRSRAIFRSAAPDEIVTGDAAKVDPLAPAGIAAAELSPDQLERLKRLLREYLGRMPDDLAAEREAKLERAGFEKIHFAWAGGASPGQPHYYRIQGPTFLVEYDDTQNSANHIHTVWRDFDGDFGRDLLREHYRQTSHQS